MSLFKRICSIVLAATMILTVFSVVAFIGANAETAPSVTVETVTVKEGEDVDVKITLGGSTKAAQFDITYDPTVATVKSTTPGAFQVATMNTATSGTIKCIFADASGLAAQLGTITFTAVGAAEASTDLTLSNVKIVDSTNVAYVETPGATNGKITVETGAVQLPATQLKFNTKSFQLGGRIALYYTLTSTVYNQYSNIYAVFEIDGEKETVYPVVRGTGYAFYFYGVWPDRIATGITTTLYGTYGGHEFSNYDWNETASPKTYEDYSLLTYIKANWNKAGKTDKEKKLFAALLNYGTAAQKYKGITKGYMNEDSDVEDLIANYSETETPTAVNNLDKVAFDGKEETCTFKTRTLALEAGITIKFSFETTATDISNMKVKFFYDSDLKNEVQNSEMEVSKLPTTVGTGGKTRYTIEYTGQNPNEFNDKVYIVIFDGTDQVSIKYGYSISTYFAKNDLSDESTPQALLYSQICKYCQVCKDYVS